MQKNSADISLYPGGAWRRLLGQAGWPQPHGLAGGSAGADANWRQHRADGIRSIRTLALLDCDGRGGRGAAASMALVIVPHEKADNGHGYQDRAKQKTEQDVAAAAG